MLLDGGLTVWNRTDRTRPSRLRLELQAFATPRELRVSVGQTAPVVVGVDVEKLAALYIPASRAAEIALAGIKAAAFVIPTHAFEKDDVEARHLEIERGFSLLENVLAGPHLADPNSVHDD